MDRLDVRLEPAESDVGNWTPVHLTVNGRPLVEIAAAFEAEQGWDPAGGYDWLATDGLRPARSRLLAKVADDWRGDGRTVVLVCGVCGEEGCWPLLARIVADDDQFVWRDFFQPHRSERDYAGLRFSFDRGAYESEIDRAFTGS